MKRSVAGLICLLLLCGCGTGKEAGPATPPPPTPVPASSPAPLSFTRDTLPRLDGSTSTAPLGEAVAAHLLGERREDVRDLIHFSKTSDAYYKLIWGEADLLIVGEPGDSVLEEKERQGFAWDMAPFATDGFVFVVNEDNPVDGLTLAQVRDIYAGKLTNWKELGGEDRPIVPFQRNEEAGSQILMKKLVMGDTPLAEPPTDYIVATMGQLIEAVKSYDGSPGAIGYTVYYYADQMEMARGLKLLRIDGVAPNPETIRAERYPLLNPKYAVIPADRGEDDPARRLYNWLLSPEGQRLVEEEGYVSMMGAGPAPMGSRRYPSYTGELIPAKNYGELVPYAGLRLMDGWPATTGCLYGLMTRTGQVVTDPVYSRVTRISYFDIAGEEWASLPVLALHRGDDDAPDGEWDPRRLAFAAADGSWCTGFDYREYSAFGDRLMVGADGWCGVMNGDGELVRRWEYADLGYAAGERPGWSVRGDTSQMSWSDGMLQLEHTPEAKFLNTETGEVITMPPVEEAMGDFHEGLAWAWSPGLVGYLDKSGKWAIEPQFHGGDDFQNGRAAVTDLEGKWKWIDPTGKVLGEWIGEDDIGVETVWDSFTGVPMQWGSQGPPEVYLAAVERQDGSNTPWYEQVGVVGGLIEILDLNWASYYDLKGNCVFRCPLGYDGD